MRIGAHLGVGGGIDKAARAAAELGLNALQIFTRSPRGGKARKWSEREINSMQEQLTEADIQPLVVHVPYLVNLAAAKVSTLSYAREVLRDDLLRADLLHAQFVVVHPGAHVGGGLEQGERLLVESLEHVLCDVGELRCQLLIENMAGQGTELGSDIERLAKLLARFKQFKVGICLDTAHSFAAGYDIRQKDVIDKIWAVCRQQLGKGAIGLIHVNDSKFECGLHKDRHASIGAGMIKDFTAILDQADEHDIALILETPTKEPSDYLSDVDVLRSQR